MAIDFCLKIFAKIAKVAYFASENCLKMPKKSKICSIMILGFSGNMLLTKFGGQWRVKNCFMACLGDNHYSLLSNFKPRLQGSKYFQGVCHAPIYNFS